MRVNCAIYFLALGAWYSTAINHRLRIRTVLIFEHRTNIPANSTTPSIENTVPPVVSSQPSSPNRMINHRTVTADVDSEGSVEEEQDVIVQTMDSETNKIRQRQIAYVDEGKYVMSGRGVIQLETIFKTNF